MITIVAAHPHRPRGRDCHFVHHEPKHVGYILTPPVQTLGFYETNKNKIRVENVTQIFKSVSEENHRK